MRKTKWRTSAAHDDQDQRGERAGRASAGREGCVRSRSFMLQAYAAARVRRAERLPGARRGADGQPGGAAVSAGERGPQACRPHASRAGGERGGSAAHREPDQRGDAGRPSCGSEQESSRRAVGLRSWRSMIRPSSRALAHWPCVQGQWLPMRRVRRSRRRARLEPRVSASSDAELLADQPRDLAAVGAALASRA